MKKKIYNKISTADMSADQFAMMIEFRVGTHE